MALKDIQVIEFEGLAPAPFCGAILSDFGANVTVIAKQNNLFKDLQEGKTILPVNLKSQKGQEIARRLCSKADVLIDPYRPGVLEHLNLGPDQLLAINPRLIYARLTGFGQTGPLSSRAGHDINYVAISGILSLLGRHNSKPFPPINLLADFAGGGLLCAFGICLALLERHVSGKGQIVDSAMSEGAAYVASWLTRSRHKPIWQEERGRSLLDGGAFFYDTYETKDGKYMSVGALESQFYKNFVRGLGLRNIPQFGDDNEEKALLVSELFKQKTQKEWTEIFEPIDACVFPVLDLDQATEHRHNKERKSFLDKSQTGGLNVPIPAPVLSRTPGKSSFLKSEGEVEKLLLAIGYGKDDIKSFQADGIVDFVSVSKL